MTQWKCHHGFTLSESCRECAIAQAAEVDRRYGPLVDAARQLITEANDKQIEQAAPCTS